MAKVIQNRLNSVVTLAGGKIRLQPRGTPGAKAEITDAQCALPDVVNFQVKGFVSVLSVSQVVSQASVPPAPKPMPKVELPKEEVAKIESIVTITAEVTVAPVATVETSDPSSSVAPPSEVVPAEPDTEPDTELEPAPQEVSKPATSRNSRRRQRH